MSLTSSTPLAAPTGGGVRHVLAPTATADNAIVSGTVYLASLVLDNSLNAADSYVRLFDHASPTVGTTVPDWVIRARAGEKVPISFYRNKPKFSTALSVCCVTVGGTAGSTSPTSAVSLTITTQTSEDAA